MNRLAQNFQRTRQGQIQMKTLNISILNSRETKERKGGVEESSKETGRKSRKEREEKQKNEVGTTIEIRKREYQLMKKRS